MANIISFDSNSVIDMGVLQTIANAINKHDDAINTLTNNMASSVAPTKGDNRYASVFDFSSNLIQWGRKRVTINNGSSVNGTSAETLQESIEFPTMFGNATTPIVVASAKFSGAQPAAVAVVTIGQISTDSFYFRVDITNDTTFASHGTVDVDWIAIGVHG